MSRERYPRVPKINMEVGHNYKFDVPASSKGKKVTEFQGKVIQITDRFITLRHILGFNESFLKVDLAQFDYQEVQ